MTRRVLALFALSSACVPGVVVAAAAAPAAAGHHAATAVIHVRPVDASGHLRSGYTITRHGRHASCSAGSEATGDAYRCFAGRFVFDPCWVTSRRHYVVCGSRPWGSEVVKLHVTRGYDNSGRTTQPHRLPWGLMLSGGTRCVFVQGAGGAVGHARINYSCQHVKDVLFGNVDRSGKVWTIRKAKPTSGGQYRKAGRVDLAKAWFGKPSRKG